MPELDQKSKDKLALCHPDLQMVFEKAIEFVDFAVICGYRNRADQDRAFAIHKSEKKWPNSKHNKMVKRLVDGTLQMVPESVAVDIGAREDSKITWDMKYYYHIAGAIKVIAQILKVDIRWGGDWDSDGNMNDQTFNDLGHFELVS